MKPKRLLTCLLATASLVTASAARADSGDLAAAQALFDRAKKLMASGKYAEACPKLEESRKLDPALGTVLNLADCYEKQGRIASAWSHFVEAQGMAHAGGHTDAEKVARERASRLSPRLSNLVVDTAWSDAPSDLEIKRDSLVVGRPQWGVPIPADPGPHTVSATAAGRKSWETTVELGANAATLTVKVPPLEPAEIGSAAPAPTPTSTSISAGTEPGAGTAGGSPPASSFGAEASADAGHGLGAQRTWALVAGGAGVAGVVVGTIFGLTSKSKHDDAEAICPGGNCGSNPQGVDRWNDARSAGNISTVAFIVGGAGLATGAVLWFTAKPASSPSMAAVVGVGPQSLMVKGTW